MNDFPVPVGLWDLPSCPQVVNQLLKLVPFESDRTPDLLDSLRWDPALTARLLAAVHPIKSEPSVSPISLEQAGHSLDRPALGFLALRFTLVGGTSEKQADRAIYETYWRHSRYRAAACDQLGDVETEPAGVSPHLIGLLGNLDRLILLRNHPRAAERIFQRMQGSGVPWCQAVPSHLTEELHNDLINRLPRDAFPQPLADFVGPVKPDPRAQYSSKEGLWALSNLAEAVADDLEFASQNPSRSAIWRERLKRRFEEFSASRPSMKPLEDVIESVRKSVVERFPSTEADSSPSPEEMLGRTNRELGRLGWEVSRSLQQSLQLKRQAEQALESHEKTISQLRHEALRDPLTGVFNRRFFLETLRKEVARSRRYGNPIGLLFLDVDAFKALNDTWGHLIGDLVLKMVAETLQKELRGADVLARYGGEEFVVLPNAPNEMEIVQLAERLRSAVETLAIPVKGGEVPVTISVGSTLARPRPSDEALGPQLLAAADAAMYDAKLLGRNRTVFRPMHDDSERELMQRTVNYSFSHWLIKRNILSEQTLEGLFMNYTPERTALGELAVEMGLLTAEQVADLMEQQAAGGEHFWSLALKQSLITADQLALLMARQRENPMQLARLLISNNVLDEIQAKTLVDEYLDSAIL